MEIEYPENINPIIPEGRPFLIASSGKNGAIELYAVFAEKLMMQRIVITTALL